MNKKNSSSKEFQGGFTRFKGDASKWAYSIIGVTVVLAASFQCFSGFSLMWNAT